MEHIPAIASAVIVIIITWGSLWLASHRSLLTDKDELNATRKAIREAQRKAKQF